MSDAQPTRREPAIRVFAMPAAVGRGVATQPVRE